MAELPTCPVCKEPIAADEPVAKQRGRADVHVRCWSITPRTDEVDEEDGAA